MVHADGSVVRAYEHLREHGVLEGLKAIWPMPTMAAWKIIFGFGLFEAALQLLLPGKRFEGPVSPSGNVPVYKVPCAGCHGLSSQMHCSSLSEMERNVSHYFTTPPPPRKKKKVE